MGEVVVCHRTSSPDDPYNIKTVPADDLRHLDHRGPTFLTVEEYEALGDERWGDIVPPFTVNGQEFEGLNWTEQGQAIYANATINPDGCTLPPPPEPAPDYQQTVFAVDACMDKSGKDAKLTCVRQVLKTVGL